MEKKCNIGVEMVEEMRESKPTKMKNIESSNPESSSLFASSYLHKDILSLV